MSVSKRKVQLHIPAHTVLKPRFPAIDAHSHFGRLLGAMVNVSEGYFDLYETRETVDRIKSFGISRVINLDGGWGDEYRRVMDKLKDAGDFIVHFGTVDVERFEEPSFEKEVYQTIRAHHENGVRGLKFWKIIGLVIKDKKGAYLRPDDQRLKCIWAAAAEFHMPVLFHISDLNAFFLPADETNEYIDTLREHPEWRFTDPGQYSFSQLMEMQENLPQVGQWLDQYPNMYIDIADRLNELGRQPYTARKFFLSHADRILFGTDMLPTDIERYPIYYRFLETFDEYFPYRTEKGIPLGDWNIYGIGLDDDALRKIYHDNIARLLGL